MIYPGLGSLDAQSTPLDGEMIGGKFYSVPKGGTELYFSMGPAQFLPFVIATEFDYVVPSASIDGAELRQDGLYLLFNVSVVNPSISLVESENPGGPYDPVGADIEQIDDAHFRAKVTTLQRAQFFRVQLD